MRIRPMSIHFDEGFNLIRAPVIDVMAVCFVLFMFLKSFDFFVG